MAQDAQKEENIQ